MSDSTDRVRILCPECNGLIASAPEDDLPTGDLVCPVCDAVVEAPTAFDKLVGDVKQAIATRVDHARQRGGGE